MKRILKVYAHEDILLDVLDFDFSDDDVVRVSADAYDRICSNCYISDFDEFGDSCDDNDVMIVEYRYYYDRDVRDFEKDSYYPITIEEEGDNFGCN